MSALTMAEYKAALEEYRKLYPDTKVDGKRVASPQVRQFAIMANMGNGQAMLQSAISADTKFRTAYNARKA